MPQYITLEEAKSIVKNICDLNTTAVKSSGYVVLTYSKIRSEYHHKCPFAYTTAVVEDCEKSRSDRMKLMSALEEAYCCLDHGLINAIVCRLSRYFEYDKSMQEIHNAYLKLFSSGVQHDMHDSFDNDNSTKIIHALTALFDEEPRNAETRAIERIETFLAKNVKLLEENIRMFSDLPVEDMKTIADEQSNNIKRLQLQFDELMKDNEQIRKNEHSKKAKNLIFNT